MPAVLRYDEPIEGLFQGVSRRRDSWIVRRQNLWPGGWREVIAPVVLVKDDRTAPPAITGVGAIVLGKTVSGFDRQLRLERLQAITPRVLWSDITEQLTATEAQAIELGRRLDEPLGERLLTLLVAIRPDLSDTIADLYSLQHVDLSGAVGERLAQEKDAVGSLLRIGHFDHGLITSWQATAADVPFLEGLGNQRQYEKTLIEHDAGRFGDWIPGDARQVGWRTFSKGSQQLFVMNADNTNVESNLGVDMVYFHEQRRSFVLVQYKKLRPDNRGMWRFTPDRRARSQLDRMRAIDDACVPHAESGEFRLLPTPCLVKLCKPETISIDAEAMIDGMYLARAHCEQLLLADGSIRGPRDGFRLVYDPGTRHLSNSLFVDLVGGGWIGSTGTSTELVAEQIRASLDSSHSVVVGIRSDLRPVRREEDREPAGSDQASLF